MTTKSETKPNPHGPEKPEKPEPKAESKRIDRELGGSDGAVKLIDQFAPMVSPRAFGVLDAAKLKELGLDAPKRKLEVTVKGEVRKYEIGQPGDAPPAASRSSATLRDNRVYLMPRGMLSQLQSSSSPHRSQAARLRTGGVRPHRDLLERQAEGVRPGRPRIADHRRLRVAEDAGQARSDGEELA